MSNSNQCKGSVKIIEVKGNSQKYSFCLHIIEDLGKNITIQEIDSNKALNDYGKGPFCKFRIHDHLDEKGLYCFVVGSKLKYIGQTIGTFRKRINAGYGNISPCNCYVGGQRTNCHVNSCINKALISGKKVLVGFYAMEDNDDIKEIEKELIRANDLVCKGWNLQK